MASIDGVAAGPAMSAAIAEAKFHLACDEYELAAQEMLAAAQYAEKLISATNTTDNLAYRIDQLINQAVLRRDAGALLADRSILESAESPLNDLYRIAKAPAITARSHRHLKRRVAQLTDRLGAEEAAQAGPNQDPRGLGSLAVQELCQDPEYRAQWTENLAELCVAQCKKAAYMFLHGDPNASHTADEVANKCGLQLYGKLGVLRLNGPKAAQSYACTVVRREITRIRKQRERLPTPVAALGSQGDLLFEGLAALPSNELEQFIADGLKRIPQDEREAVEHRYFGNLVGRPSKLVKCGLRHLREVLEGLI
jgi:DNA-directed RNA polymerase specialized sigma24 family protein